MGEDFEELIGEGTEDRADLIPIRAHLVEHIKEPDEAPGEGVDDGLGVVLVGEHSEVGDLVLEPVELLVESREPAKGPAEGRLQLGDLVRDLGEVLIQVFINEL